MMAYYSKRRGGWGTVKFNTYVYLFMLQRNWRRRGRAFE
jgi:hypothetical protein